MLVLSRKKDERLVLGDGINTITVNVVEIRGNSVRLGIEAPNSIKILREELIEIQE
jgi:carbon storage regulator